jgi:hypothetical protein
VFLVVIVTGLALIPGCRWRAVGWVRNESFYRALPTSYWREEIANGKLLTARTLCMPLAAERRGNLQKLLPSLKSSEPYTLFDAPFQNMTAAFVLTDPDSVPVLRELLLDPDWRVRLFAVQALKSTADEYALVAQEALLHMLRSEDIEERHNGMQQLAAWWQWRKAPRAIPVLIAALEADNPQLTADALEVMVIQPQDFGAALPSLLALRGVPCSAAGLCCEPGRPGGPRAGQDSGRPDRTRQGA